MKRIWYVCLVHWQYVTILGLIFQIKSAPMHAFPHCMSQSIKHTSHPESCSNTGGGRICPSAKHWNNQVVCPMWFSSQLQKMYSPQPLWSWSARCFNFKIFSPRGLGN